MTMICILYVLVVNEHNYFYKNETKDEPLNFFELVYYTCFGQRLSIYVFI